MIRICAIDDVIPLTDLAYQLNNIPKHNIGYCYKKYDKIKNDFTEIINNQRGIIIGSYRDKLQGFIALFYGEDSADVCGPFINEDEEYNTIFYELWSYIINNVAIKQFNFFLNKENEQLITVLHELKAINNGNEYIYTLDYACFSPQIITLNITLLQASHYQEFIILQDTIFPATYVTGQDIINDLNQLRKVYVCLIDDHIASYCVIKYTDDKCYIEILAVLEPYRNQHIGSQLLSYVIQTESKTYQKFMLVVEKKNEIAMKLYQKIGFKLFVENCSYMIETKDVII